MAPRRTSRSIQRDEVSEHPPNDSDQGSSSGAEEPISGPEDEPQTTDPQQRAHPKMSLTDAALRITVFNGEHPMRTARWLQRIETLYPEGSMWYNDRMSMAMMRVQGEAKDIADGALPDDWEDFKECLLEYFDPETAVTVLGEQLDDRSRYKGVPAMQALQLAIRDRMDLRWYYGADTHDRTILAALKVIFPAAVLTAVAFKPTGDFNALVRQLKEQVVAANARNDTDSKWVRNGQTQAFSATPKGKKDKDKKDKGKKDKGKKSGKKTESAAAPPAINAQIHDLQEQVTKLTELITQHHF
ncbi:hypothetical protein GQ54DRAFT_154762 [Martensiomyces pterosporus]|nr:hypothetical protein GQ54DRAFT_154762 [Martensiomyces pterosporus]